MRICLIVTGGIAAVKIYDLVRKLIQDNHQVTCVLT
ncbi:MAG: flavoprotein, partial [Pseudomonadota bacterium]